MATINPLPAAGVGATAALRIDDSGLRGQVRLVTGITPAAGPLAAILLDQQPTVDADVYLPAVFGPNYASAVFMTAEMLLTPWVLPPPGVGIFAVAHLNAQGQMDGFGIVATGALAPSTPYRFSWRVLT
jgi:hypothetical protein